MEKRKPLICSVIALLAIGLVYYRDVYSSVLTE